MSPARAKLHRPESCECHNRCGRRARRPRRSPRCPRFLGPKSLIARARSEWNATTFLSYDEGCHARGDRTTPGVRQREHGTRLPGRARAARVATRRTKGVRALGYVYVVVCRTSTADVGGGQAGARAAPGAGRVRAPEDHRCWDSPPARHDAKGRQQATRSRMRQESGERQPRSDFFRDGPVTSINVRAYVQLEKKDTHKNRSRARRRSEKSVTFRFRC